MAKTRTLALKTQLLVNEIFYSLQGESSFAGKPCAFVRLARCDLRCAWCDTEYAFFEGKKMDLTEIVDRVSSFPTELVLITGGEPLLQENVHSLVVSLLDLGKLVVIETGGHKDIRPVDLRATLVYDIKCPDSGMSAKNLWSNLKFLRPQDEIKFVIASRRDYEWARETVSRSELVNREILFSPAWDMLDPRELGEWILEDGLEVRLQIQLHKLLWGKDTRGV
jgi:7-carboxy-7-deazaguanine synthase